ncbi:M18 family aminopeptidase [Corynebacterium pygosceleis]|uniref:M18 family aminopeptidase n=1 Tax=Corynebacterium pygosceleis TaxID=2800406 RepID=A0A9Q4C6D9_9CORY|nr:M18 family aminopeptidase [Corynebacterium pygosceleis]MCK7637051.1 M18 family aminopeptidase [Corynebacterium pygosceleis]MCL0120177.1 M18 family aminopeptidase [Corynebacterium pygosceleis]MCX7443721.1 M18 family aminopeptidase [Corynebacterium pygosceleis]MCX7467804.1 M18 family aminopeptidase [Corynebacterium pygosceleis]
MISFSDFIHASPSSYHAADQVRLALTAVGFTEQDEADPWDASPGGHVMVRGGAVMAWYVPEGAGPDSGFRIVGAHTDSPGLKLKSVPDTGTAGWRQAACEVYGGPVLSSLLDRELRLAGRVFTADGNRHLVDTGPLLRVPNLAIHLDPKVNKGFEYDPQRHLCPVLGTGEPRETVLETVARLADIDGEIIAHDLVTCDTQAPELFGAERDLLSAPRLDNLSSVWPATDALTTAVRNGGADGQADVLVLAAFDYEEVGSGAVTGAAGPILHNVLERTADALGATGIDARTRMYARSSCISADAAHSVHPNFAERHDPVNGPLAGLGPALKVNAKQRYATDAESAVLWHRACSAAGAPNQVFVSANHVPCGTTIGPITATRLGITTLDVGVPILSMHSAREMAAVRDIDTFTRILGAYYAGA